MLLVGCGYLLQLSQTLLFKYQLLRLQLLLQKSVINMYYMNQGSYKKEPDWQSRSDARLEKWLKQKKEEKRRSDERRIFVQEKGVKDETDKN